MFFIYLLSSNYVSISYASTCFKKYILVRFTILSKIIWKDKISRANNILLVVSDTDVYF